jgi:hypothetical protein
MAELIDIQQPKQLFTIDLLRYFQSGKVSFLIGSGASIPAISAGGDIENELKELAVNPAQELDYQNKLYSFLSGVQKVQNDIVKDNPQEMSETCQTSLINYKTFVQNIVFLLLARNNTILPKRTNIFSTNYDMFLEKACEEIAPLYVNDGFVRTCKINTDKFPFSTHTFSNCMHNAGDYYKTEIPTINIIKLHGSLSWQSDGDKIVYGNKAIENIPEADLDNLEYLKTYTAQFRNIIIPTPKKFEDTVLIQTYYDLLRIYSNELDKENSILFVFGFSFNDEHILEITKRALKNTTLELVIFAYSSNAARLFKDKFSNFQNVKIIYTTENGQNLDFAKFNELLLNIKPERQNG